MSPTNLLPYQRAGARQKEPSHDPCTGRSRAAFQLPQANLRPPWGPWLVQKWWGEFTGTLPNETGVVVEVEVLAAGELVGWAAYY
jgi:hypothetical protein